MSSFLLCAVRFCPRAWASSLAAVALLHSLAVGCSTPANDPNSGGGQCTAGQVACGTGACVSLQMDANNCGSCGHACQAGQSCQSGACQCVAPLSACGSSCVNRQSDPANCGSCGSVCGDGLLCSLGACSSSCAAGLSVCGAGCVDTQVDVLNCGSCGSACGTGKSCSGGVCSCAVPGQQACAGQCTDVQTNTQNCGVCGVLCAAGQTCSGGLCTGQTQATGGSNAGGAGSGGSSAAGGVATGGAGGNGNGLQVGTQCLPVCANASTDPDGDGYGYEGGRSCVVAGSLPSMGASACQPPPPDNMGIPPGDGFYIDMTCHPPCASDATDADTSGVKDGWGYEMGRSCIVVGSAPAMTAIRCIPTVAATGDGYKVGELCVSACTHPEWADAMGYGYEAQQTCVVTGSPAASQNARCMLQARTLPTPGTGFMQGETCFPACGASAADVTADGYGWDANRTCIVAASKAAVQGLPCVPPPNTVTGECPRTLTCPVVGGTTLACGCTWVEGLAARKQEIMAVSGASQYFLASAMMETAGMKADYTLGDGKTGDAFNAGICKQNWGMIRRCHLAWNSQTATQYMTSTAMNSSLSLDIEVYNECRSMFGDSWWSGHRNGYNNLGTSSTDIQQFKGAMDWTNQMLTDHLTDDVRFWVKIQAI